MSVNPNFNNMQGNDKIKLVFFSSHSLIRICANFKQKTISPM